MSLTFYRAPMSTATATELVIEELGIPHETVTVDIRKGESKKPEYLKMDPNGRVPLLVHDGTVIFESAAIAIYLGETFGVAKKLWPEGRARGEAMKWVVWANVTLADTVGRWQRNTSAWTPADHHNAKAGEAGLADLHAGLRILDEALDGRAYLCGDYTLADTHLNAFVDWVGHLSVDLSKYARLQAWSKRCSERPAYQRVMSREAP
jgi:glutathione S-transferase